MRPPDWPTDPRYHGTSSPYLATMLAAIMGTILASLGLLQLGFLVNFISSYVNILIADPYSNHRFQISCSWVHSSSSIHHSTGTAEKDFRCPRWRADIFYKAEFSKFCFKHISVHKSNIFLKTYLKIYQILKELFDGNANWYDFTIGIISILLLIGLKELKKRAKDYDSLRKGFKYNNLVFMVFTNSFFF